MVMKRLSVGILLSSIFVLVAIACRTGEPSSDPKTPANSPLPKVERTDDDPKEPPKPPLLGDAG
jgi:hypothetical protein